MRPVLVIAAKDLRQRLRDRSAIVIAVVAPLVVAALMSAAFRGVEDLHATIAVADEDHGAVAARLVAALASPGLSDVVTVRREPSAAAVRSAVRAGRAGAGVVVPAGFSASVAGPSPGALTVVTSVNDDAAAQIARSVVGSFTAQLDADRLSLETAIAAGAPPATRASLAAEVARLRLPVATLRREVDARRLKAISYFAPAMAIFFLLFVVSFTSRSFFVDRDQGMVDRILAAPVSRGELVAGKALAALAFGGVSIGVLMVVTATLFGADWGAPLAAALVALAMVLAVVALTALVIVLARTQRQAETIASIVVFGLAVLGGNFVLLSVAPPLLRRLALLTPNGWALRAFTDLATTGGGVGTVALPLLAISGIALAVAALAAVLAPRVARR